MPSRKDSLKVCTGTIITSHPSPRKQTFHHVERGRLKKLWGLLPAEVVARHIVCELDPEKAHVKKNTDRWFIKEKSWINERRNITNIDYREWGITEVLSTTNTIKTPKIQNEGIPFGRIIPSSRVQRVVENMPGSIEAVLEAHGSLTVYIGFSFNLSPFLTLW